MLRERFDRIEIIDLRGDVRRGERAGVDGDQGVFNIQVGTAITLAIADRSKADGELADVSYIDSWAEGWFSRDAKLNWLIAGSETRNTAWRGRCSSGSFRRYETRAVSKGGVAEY
jgi:predicted helicase